MQTPNPEEGWWRSFSAPGTEAFKQDFARWESLKRTCSSRSKRSNPGLRTSCARARTSERLNAGGHDAVDEAYREHGRPLLSLARRAAKACDRTRLTVAAPIVQGAPFSATHVPMRFAVALPWWGYALAFLRRLVCAWWAYARVAVALTRSQHAALVGLRALTLVLLVVFLLRPVMMVPIEGARDSVVRDPRRCLTEHAHRRRRRAAARSRTRARH